MHIYFLPLVHAANSILHMFSPQPTQKEKRIGKKIENTPVDLDNICTSAGEKPIRAFKLVNEQACLG